jgi:hypothetical protein
LSRPRRFFLLPDMSAQSFNALGTRLASGGLDRAVLVWDTDTPALREVLAGPSAMPNIERAMMHAKSDVYYIDISGNVPASLSQCRTESGF